MDKERQAGGCLRAIVFLMFATVTCIMVFRAITGMF